MVWRVLEMPVVHLLHGKRSVDGGVGGMLCSVPPASGAEGGITRCSEKDIDTQNTIRATTPAPYIWMQPPHQTKKEQTLVTLYTI